MGSMPTLRDMLNAGVHFGHKTSRWHPKMEPYIFMAKNGVHVINLEKTEEELVRAVEFLKKMSAEGKIFVFVGSKKQATNIIKEAALSCNMPYVNNRWVGGLLTNFETVKTAIANYKRDKELLEKNADNMSKKELARLRGKVEKSEKIFGGLTEVGRKPDGLILLGSHDEKNALREALIEGIPTVAIVDTNADPTQITYPVPANDDATKSIELFANLFAQVIRENKPVAKVADKK